MTAGQLTRWRQTPEAQAAFDGLATVYGKAWLRWIEAIKRRPQVRAARIAEMVRQVEAGLPP